MQMILCVKGMFSFASVISRNEEGDQVTAPHFWHLVVVAGHSIYIGSNFLDAKNNSNWYLMDYQRVPGAASSFVEHIELGVEVCNQQTFLADKLREQFADFALLPAFAGTLLLYPGLCSTVPLTGWKPCTHVHAYDMSRLQIASSLQSFRFELTKHSFHAQA
jgi:hypothetical protein